MPWIAAIFYGLKPAVLAIVAAAVLRLGSKALKNPVMGSLAGCAFVALPHFKIGLISVIIASAGLGSFQHCLL